MGFLTKITLATDARAFVNITNQIADAVKKSGIKDGIAVVYTPHTTAAVTINENADPDVLKDLNYGLSTSFPNHNNYVHFENNSDAHLKSSLISASLSLIISDNKLLLGQWQDVYFCEFDGPRKRFVYIKLIEG